MRYRQQSLFAAYPEQRFDAPFPATRYQGSKQKIVEWIWNSIHHLPFDSVLDVFGGSGTVSHHFKVMGKCVLYNDHLRFNWLIGLGLIENSADKLTPEDLDALQTPTGCDLVYLDPPYLNNQGIGVDYREFYHFLEGMTLYDDWSGLIDGKSKHKRLKPVQSPWNQTSTILDAFDQLVARHRHSILVISYRDDGIPNKSQLLDVLAGYKRHVVEAFKPKQYVLSSKRSHELLLIAE
jgi:adenine-specific DNA methylase